MYKGLLTTLNLLITLFKHLYTFIVTYYYAFKYFKPIHAYYLLNVLIYSILTIVRLFLLVCTVVLSALSVLCFY